MRDDVKTSLDLPTAELDALSDRNLWIEILSELRAIRQALERQAPERPVGLAARQFVPRTAE